LEWQASNNKHQITKFFKHQTLNPNRLENWSFEFDIYLEFEVWDL